MKIDKTLQALLNGLYEGAYVLDRARNIVFWNKAAEEITGYKAEEVLGKSCKDNILRHVDKNGNELCLGTCPMVFAMINKVAVSDEVYLHHKSGFRLFIKVKGIPIFDNGNEAKGVIELFTPVISNSDSDDLLNLALKDSLTKVYNRKGFDFLYPIRQREMTLFKFNTGILFFDIDDFKRINDHFGHEAGDRVLYAVAQIFVKFLRHEDIVVRWGGEEFVLIIFLKEIDKMEMIGNKLVRLVESTFVDYKGNIIKFTVSGGGTFLRENENIIQAINRADELMYKAKRRGKNQFLYEQQRN